MQTILSVAEKGPNTESGKSGKSTWKSGNSSYLITVTVKRQVLKSTFHFKSQSR